MNCSSDIRTQIAELERELQELELRHLPTRGVTLAITACVERWARKNRWTVTREHRLEGYSRPGDSRRGGRIDLLLRRHRDVGPPIAVEIDRRDKRISIAKLLHCSQLGHIPVWIRWLPNNGRCVANVPPPITLLKLPLGPCRAAI